MDFSKINIGLLNSREGEKKPIDKIFDVTPELEKKLAEIVARKKKVQAEGDKMTDESRVMPSVNRVTDIKDVHRDVQDIKKISFGDNYLISCNAAGVARRAIATAVKGYTNMRMKNLDIRKWSGKIPYEGSAHFMVDFMDKSGCPRSANIEVKIACGEAKEPNYFTDNKGTKYEMSHDGFDQMLGEIIDIEDIRKPEENVFTMPGKSLQLNAMKKKADNPTVNEVLGLEEPLLDNAFVQDWYEKGLVVAIEPDKEDVDIKMVSDMVYDLKEELLKHYPDKDYVEIKTFGAEASMKKKAQEDREFPIGANAQIAINSGVDSEKKGIIIEDKGDEVIIQTEDGEEISMFKDRVLVEGDQYRPQFASLNKKADEEENKEEDDETYEKPQEGEKVDDSKYASTDKKAIEFIGNEMVLQIEDKDGTFEAINELDRGFFYQLREAIMEGEVLTEDNIDEFVKQVQTTYPQISIETSWEVEDEPEIEGEE